MNIQEISDIQSAPSTLNRTLFSGKDRQIISWLKGCAESICRSTIPASYIQRCLNNFKRGFLYRDSNTIMGFVVWKEKIHAPPHMDVRTPPQEPKRYMEVLLICSRPTDYRLGGIMLYDIEEYSIQKKMLGIELYPANPDVAEFYIKYHYKINSTSWKIIKMQKILQPIYMQRTKKTRKAPRSVLPSRGTLQYNKIMLHEHLHNDHNYEILNNWVKNWPAQPQQPEGTPQQHNGDSI